MIDQVKANIKQKIKERKLTTQQVCKALGSDRMYIYRTTDKVSLDKLVRIAQAIGCSPGELLEGL